MTEDYVLNLIDRAASGRAFAGGQCFACGGEPSSGDGEHIIPRWASQIVFHLYDGEAKLTDLSRKIGSVAEPGKHAKLNIVKQIIQG